MTTNRRAVKSDGGGSVVGEAHRVEFNEAKEIAAHSLILHDLQFVEMATKKLLEMRDRGEKDLILPRCLWTGAIEAYSRCFAEGRRYRLQNAQVFDGQPGELKRHDVLMGFRNRHTAHSVSGLEQAETGIHISDNGELKVGTVAIFADAPPSDIVNDLRHTSEIVFNQVKARGMEIREELLKKASALTVEEINSSPVIEVQSEYWSQPAPPPGPTAPSQPLSV